MPVLVSVVENGCGATAAEPPVTALKRADFPALGSPTIPSRSIGPRIGAAGTLLSMSKRTVKARTRARKKKANHGRKPNRGR